MKCSYIFLYIYSSLSARPHSSLVLFWQLSSSSPIHLGLEKYLTFHSIGTLKKWLHISFFFFFCSYSFHYFHITRHPRACVRVCVSVTNRKIAEFKWPIVTEFEANPTSPLSASCNWKFKHRAPAEFWTKNLRTQQKYCSRIAGADEQADRQKKAKNATPTSQKSVYLLQTLTEHYESDFT